MLAEGFHGRVAGSRTLCAGATEYVVGSFSEESALKATVVNAVVEFGKTRKGRELVVHVFGELNVLADGDFIEGFSKRFPGDGVENGVIPGGGAAGGIVGSLDEVIAHDGGVAGGAYVFGERFGDLVLVSVKGGFGAGDPGGERPVEVGGISWMALTWWSVWMLIWAKVMSSSYDLVRY